MNRDESFSGSRNNKENVASFDQAKYEALVRAATTTDQLERYIAGKGPFAEDADGASFVIDDIRALKEKFAETGEVDADAIKSSALDDALKEALIRIFTKEASEAQGATQETATPEMPEEEVYEGIRRIDDFLTLANESYPNGLELASGRIIAPREVKNMMIDTKNDLARAEDPVVTFDNLKDKKLAATWRKVLQNEKEILNKFWNQKAA